MALDLGAVWRDVGPALRTLRRRPGVLALAVLEIAIGVTTINALLISGGWYQTLGARPSGMDERNLILVSTYTARPLNGRHCGDQADSDCGEDELHSRQAADRALAATPPQVEAVSRISGTILEDRWSYPSAFVGRAAARPNGEEVGDDIGWAYHADANLPATAGLRLVAGGVPAAATGPRADGGPSAALLTECLARRLFGEPARAVGGTLSGERARDVPVLGVVADVTMKVPFMPHSACVAFLFGAVIDDHETRLLVRARPGQRQAAITALRAVFAPGSGPQQGHLVHVQPFDSTRGLHHKVGGGMVRLLSEIGVMMGVVALLASLAATSFLVAERKRQIGVRRALGATRADIVRYFLVESGIATAIGALVGMVFTVALYALMVRIFQDITFQAGRIAVALGLLSLASMVATLVPALGAARVPPSVASRSL